MSDVNLANNSFVEQIVANAQAAIDHVVGMGVADSERIGIGGVSYRRRSWPPIC
ncbi:MAG: hypothetical protein U5J83_02900 [Bryobacterales bacterium]|nr:hypothetical protein [Bryobacterales bacterium]